MIVMLLPLLSVACRQEKTYRIGVSQCSQDDWRSKMNDEISREAMFHDDINVEIRSADDSNSKQIADIRYFADNGFDIIIVSPNEADALTPVISEVYRKGIPVIIFDRNINGDTYTARIGVDDTGIGRSAARYAMRRYEPRPRVIEISGRLGSTPAVDRHRGFADELRRGGGEIVASVPGDWNQDDAVRVADSLLNIYPDVDLIYAHNDRMAIGASEVARRRGLDSIRIIGIDAAPAIGIRAVADSVIDATFLYPTEGHRLIQRALQILKKEPYPHEEVIPASSAVDLTNADILLLQNEAIAQETAKMHLLKARIDAYWAQHSSQTSLFYASIAILVLLFGVLFLVLRAYWQHRRHQRVLMEQNRLLEEQRDKQQQLNEQLKEATQSKLVFFTNVSHDLRTPLTLIAEPVAQLAAADNLTPGQHTLMKIANKNVKILQRLINQILDFRKYESGKLDLHLAETDMRATMLEWVESFVSMARGRHIKLEYSIPEGEGWRMAVDTEKIERVFFNLLSNAFKYTPDNGTIRLDCRCDGTTLTFSVADTGTGIAPEDLGRVFEHFYQGEKIHAKGSGIGLWLAKSFVELHGGTVEVESAVGKGTKFTVTLPVRHVADDAVKAERNITDTDIRAELEVIEPTDADLDNERPRLLVIDDNPDIRRMVAQLMADDYNVITAPDGREGVRMAARYVPDLIICDVMMPGMDGMECCKRIKAEVSTSHIPLLMLTACSLDEQRIEGYDSGADGYLAKPFNSAVLKSRCGALIANRKRIRDLFESRVPGAPAQAMERNESAPALPQGDIDSDFYRRFLAEFNSRMSDATLNVETLAAAMGLGHSQFYRKIKALTNYTPVELMRKLRLEQARAMLVSTDRNISEIAYEVGFSTPAYFTKCYRTAYGETPTELRDRLGAGA